MEYRECRLKTIYTIFSEGGVKIDIQKIFLLIGGIRSGIYISNVNSMPIFTPNGLAKINYPYILDKFGISYKAISLESFLNKYRDKKYKENMFIVLFNSSMLRERKYENISGDLIGQSQLLVRDVDYKNKKIILDVENSDEHWIDFDVYKQVEKKSLWLVGDALYIYEIDKSLLRSNKKIQQLANIDNKKILKQNLENFQKDEKEVYYENNKTLRIDGYMSYEIIINNLIKLKEKYIVSKNKENMRRYLRVFISNLKRFITMGSEANYRNEFVDVLNYVFKEYMTSDVEESIKIWKDISMRWIKITIIETKLEKKQLSDKVIIECLDNFISFYKEILELEREGVDRLLSILNKEI